MPSDYKGASPFKKDGWDWPFIVYAGTVILRRKEEDLWRMTPRKFNALMRVYIDLKGSGQDEAPSGNDFIDNIPGW